jgi:hypothetical protein
VSIYICTTCVGNNRSRDGRGGKHSRNRWRATTTQLLNAEKNIFKVYIKSLTATWLPLSEKVGVKQQDEGMSV